MLKNILASVLAIFALVFLIFPSQVSAAPNWYTSQFAYSFCQYPLAKIYVFFQNDELRLASNAMLVTATHVQSNLKIDLGRVEAGASASGTIIPNLGTGSDQLAAGTVRFDLKWVGRSGTDVKYANFNSITCSPTASLINSFDVYPKNSEKTILTWETATEYNIAGFNAWRSIKEIDGPTFKEETKVGGEMIPVKNPGQVIANSYRLVDEKVKSGRTYRYRIEAIGVNGRSLESTKAITVRTPDVGEPRPPRP